MNISTVCVLKLFGPSTPVIILTKIMNICYCLWPKFSSFCILFGVAKVSNLWKVFSIKIVFSLICESFSLESSPLYDRNRWEKARVHKLLVKMIDRRENEGNVHSKCGGQVWFTTRPSSWRSSSSRRLLYHWFRLPRWGGMTSEPRVPLNSVHT